jgi:GGDEF domain-containing protein
MTSVDLALLEIEHARYEHLFDPQTRLAKWALLLDRTTIALARSRRTGSQVALFVLDEPHFGSGPNDLSGIVATLLPRLRPDDTLARIGDLRLAVMCNEMRADEDAALVARRLIYETGIICGLGVALGATDDTPDGLISRALRELSRSALDA